jgi:hypothetical protein
LLGDDVTDVHVEKRVVTQRFFSVEHFADYFITYYGPTHKAAESLTPDDRAALRDDVIALGSSSNVARDDTFVSHWEYLLTFATKR